MSPSRQDGYDKAKFDALLADAKKIEAEINTLLVEFTDARRKYFRTKSDDDKREWERLDAILNELVRRHSDLGPELVKASGFSKQELDEFAQHDSKGDIDVEDRQLRNQLTADKVEITGFLQDSLPAGIDGLSRLVPKEWRSDQASWQLDGLVKGEQPLSLVKGLRVESEQPSRHRLSQMLAVAEDYLNDQPAFDQFAAPTLVAQLAQFGRWLPQLKEVGGDVEGRISKLWREPGENVDATMFELLVAAGCVDMGRRVEFISETQEKSPDIRSYDPFPLVIECKRRRALSDYELEEEKLMRSLFFALEKEAQKKGMVGRFDLELKVEAHKMPSQEITARLISQRLAARPDRPLEYPWGSAAFHDIPRNIMLPHATRVYSANMLRAAFNWNSDLPEWDGLICRINNEAEPKVDQIRSALGLVWKNISLQATVKRAWAPISLFGDATGQIPPGEYGIIYLAYVEGAREQIADRRVNNFMMRLKQWEHASSIRIPISFLMRLYPRTLEGGEPDFIESAIRLGSGAYPMPDLFDDFPNSVFTHTPRQLK